MITDYTSLQAEVAGWLARADLTSQIPTFIQLAEARFNRDVRVREMQATEQGTLVSSSISLPAQCRAIQSLRIYNGATYDEIQPLPPSYLGQIRPTGTALGYVVEGNVAHIIGGTGSNAYKLTYFQEIPALATSPLNRNWLIQREPGLYLYGTLLEASPYIQDDARAAVWVTQYKDILDGMTSQDDMARVGAAPRMNTVGMP